jgi:streptomycin 6-kinase
MKGVLSRRRPGGALRATVDEMDSAGPNIDAALRQRLAARYGSEVEEWLATLPALLTAVAEEWELELDSPIPLGNASAVFHCRLRDARRAVLKASPDRSRLKVEASALTAWRTVHSPTVIAFDDQLGALLLEAIEPGTPLIVSMAYPDVERIARLLRALHGQSVPTGPYPSVAERVDDLFRSSTKLYERDPHLTGVIPFELYERGHALATRLARHNVETVLLHGDLTPRNILEGGGERGLVAIDPTPCRGDGAFDAVDLILWQAADLESIHARTEVVAAAIGVEARRLLSWCCAFGGMVALELASEGSAPPPRIDALQKLASQAELT